MLTKIEEKSSLNLVKCLLIGVLVFIIMPFKTVFAAEDTLATVYHIYMDDQFIGNTTDKKAVDKIINDKIEKIQEVYPNYHFVTDHQLTYVKETAFSTLNSDTDVFNSIKDGLQVKAEAYAVTVEDEAIVYLPSQEEAQEVVKQLKLSYITAEELAAFEAANKAEEVLQPLTQPGSRITNIQFSKEIGFSKTVQHPMQLSTAADALALLAKGKQIDGLYKVKAGDTVEGIAKSHGLTNEEIIQLNPMIDSDNVIKAGQELTVKVAQPYVDVIVEREFFKQETIDFESQVKEDANLPKGETRIKQEGKVGMSEVNLIVSEKNGQLVSQTRSAEKVLTAPVAEIAIKGTKVIPSRGSGSFAWPAVGGYISSEMGYRWGKMHKGIDIARPSDRTIKAADNGIVVFSGTSNGYGNKVTIDHQNGLQTVYGHLASIDVKKGQIVEKGSKIGVMGNTGRSTGIHLHFEVLKSGKHVDPLKYVNR